MQGEAARTRADRLDIPAISPVLRKRMAKGMAIDDDTLAASRAARPQLLRNFEDTVLGRTDAAILPVMAIRTPPIAEVDPTSASFSARRLYELSNHCRFVDMLGLPAIAIPVALAPLGAQPSLQSGLVVFKRGKTFPDLGNYIVFGGERLHHRLSTGSGRSTKIIARPTVTILPLAPPSYI
jgi:hypothetical protein